MTLADLLDRATVKDRFTNLTDYIEFCKAYLNFIESGLQATIVSRNENNYRFFQYREDGYYNISRPINSQLMYGSEFVSRVETEFIRILGSVRDVPLEDHESREVITRSIYMIQQAIGATLDALPAGSANQARKLNGDLFERLIQLLIRASGARCGTGTVQVPVYLDKFLYSKLTETALPHVAIFLNDVQRTRPIRDNQYGVNSTFLSGHFKAFTVKLNPLDGVYYCDIRPRMRTDELLSQHIQTIDHFFCDDLWTLLGADGLPLDAVEIIPEGGPI